MILVLATVVFLFAKTPACAGASTAEDFERRRNLWFGITLTAFLANSFGIYIIVAAMMLLFASRREPNKLAMFFFLLFAVPILSSEIGGLGVISHLFTIHYVRLLALILLLPAYLSLRKQPDVAPFGRLLPDKLLIGYVMLVFVLTLPISTFTNTLRYTIFYPFLDVFLPYYVASRSLRHPHEFRDALMGFAVAALVLSAVGATEYWRGWLLYSPLKEALGTPWNLGNYLGREGGLRALGSTGHPIVLGYVITVAMGFFLYLKKSVPNTAAWYLGFMLLMVGLISSLSRGPWVGAAAMLLVFIAMGPFPVRRLLLLGLLSLMMLPILLVSPLADKVLSYLPFVGTVEQNTVTFRQALLEASIQVVLHNPLFGSPFYYSAPEMQELLQAGGFLDVVNTYVGVALPHGLVGLSLFSGVFIAAGVGIFRGMRSVADKDSDIYLLGRALFSTLLGILVIIFTVSSITVVPVIYWSVAGLGIAYARMVAHKKHPAKAPDTARHSGLQQTYIKRL